MYAVVKLVLPAADVTLSADRRGKIASTFSRFERAIAPLCLAQLLLIRVEGRSPEYIGGGIPRTAPHIGGVS